MTAARQASRVMRSLRSRCRSEVARNVWMRRRSAGASARAASSMSCGRQRASAAMTGRRTSRAMCATASASAGDAIGKPASMMSTPSASSARAICTLAGTSSEKPGGLLAVAQRGVEDDDTCGISSHGFSVRAGGLEVKVIIITIQ